METAYEKDSPFKEDMQAKDGCTYQEGQIMSSHTPKNGKYGSRCSFDTHLQSTRRCPYYLVKELAVY
jgi:hypothetical protein